MTIGHHLTLCDLVLQPSGEWVLQRNEWFMLRVAEGIGYWLQPGLPAREMRVGDCLLTLGNGNGVARASQLGPLKLQYFSVQPQYLSGLFTVTEWHQFEAASKNVPTLVFAFSAGEPLAKRFASLAEQPLPDKLPMRCELLQLWAAAIARLLPPAPIETPTARLRERFRQVIGQMAEPELSQTSLSDLAGRLNCSERHFNRLFREEFGVPLRSRQIEWRLQRASQLLADADAKIINIAHECGYQHLGLFNAMFKKRFGMTPSEWRQRTQPRKNSRPARILISKSPTALESRRPCLV